MANDPETHLEKVQQVIDSLEPINTALAAVYEAMPKPYDATATYAQNSMIVRSGKIYRNATAINTPKAYDAADWTALT